MAAQELGHAVTVLSDAVEAISYSTSRDRPFSGPFAR